MSADHYEGKQIVLLDEQGQEIDRGPDIYADQAIIMMHNATAYGFIERKTKDRTVVRYFQAGRFGPQIRDRAEFVT